MKSIAGVSFSLVFMALATHTNADDGFPFLRPESVRSTYESQQKNWLPIPPVLKTAFLVAEDRNFFDRSAARSTITRTITYWYPEKGRALQSSRTQDWAVSAAVSTALDHDEILNWFIHESYLGRDCWGVDGASNVYFAKRPSEIEAHEAASLAVLVRQPNLLDHDRSPDRALEWRNIILQELAQRGYISQVDANIATAKPLGVQDPLGRCAAQDE